MANLTGIKYGGRKKGTKNKVTKPIVEGVHEVFNNLGGVKGMTAWAKKNQSEFYSKIYKQLIPTQSKVENSGSMTIQKIEVEIVDPET